MPALKTRGRRKTNNTKSQLYIRLMTGFFTHRKTNKLRRLFGNDAFWIPPRLWAYAAENQPDGNFSTYTSEELSELLGCSKHAQAMLQALKECGFIDESGILHDWNFHNRYHKSFSDRSKKAAKARWDKERSNRPPKEETGHRTVDSGDKHCSSNAPSINGYFTETTRIESDPYPIPENIRTQRVVKLWGQWLEHLKQKSKTPTILAAEMQLKKLSTMGEARAIAAIEASIEGNWQGIYEPKGELKPNHQTHQKPISQMTDQEILEATQ